CWAHYPQLPRIETRPSSQNKQPAKRHSPQCDAVTPPIATQTEISTSSRRPNTCAALLSTSAFEHSRKHARTGRHLSTITRRIHASRKRCWVLGGRIF